jgi:hypothetical protein
MAADRLPGATVDKPRPKVKMTWPCFQNDRKRSQKIAAVKASMQPHEADTIFWDELANEEINQIAAVHRQQPFPQLQPGLNTRPCSGTQQQSAQSQHRVPLLQKEWPHAKGVQLSSS